MKKILFISFVATILFAGCSVSEQPVAEYAPSEQNLMQSFFISTTENPQLKKDIQFDYDSLSNTYYFATQQFINHIDSLVPTFFADGDTYVGQQEQLTGISAQDFSQREVTYTIRNTRNMTCQSSTVSIVSPQTTGLPVIQIDIDGNRKVADRETYLPAKFTLSNCSQPFTATIGIRGRGNSTWWQEKKPYRIRFEEKTTLFGMHTAHSYVLLANALDPTLMTNTVALEIAGRMNLPFTNHTQAVELFVNGSYEGSYLLTEQIQVHKGRVEVDTLQGGFLVEVDANFDREYQFRTNACQLPVMLRQPEGNDALQMIKGVFKQLETALRRHDFEQASALTDMRSMARYLLFSDLVHNIELGHPKSVFCFRRDASSPIEWGPAWDYDWAFGYGTTKYIYFLNPERLMFDLNSTQVFAGGGAGNKFISLFFQMPQFRQIYKEEWQAALPMLQDIDQFVYFSGTALDYSWLENQKRWQNIPYSKRYYYLEMMSYLNKRIETITENTK